MIYVRSMVNWFIISHGVVAINAKKKLLFSFLMKKSAVHCLGYFANSKQQFMKFQYMLLY